MNKAHYTSGARMERAKAFVDRAKAMLLTAFVAGGDIVKSIILEGLGASGAAGGSGPSLAAGVFWALYIVGFYLTAELVQIALNASVDHSRTLRRVIDRERFIEGVWIDVVFPKGDPTRRTGGIVWINFVDGQYKISGESYREDGSRVGNFRSIVARFDHPTLLYSFTKFDNLAAMETTPGYCEYAFQGERARARRFDGHFFKEGDLEKYIVYGRLATKEEERRIRAGDRASVVLALMAESAPRSALAPLP